MLVYLQRVCREAEDELPSVAPRTHCAIRLANVREALARARDIGMYWRPAEETVELRRWVERGRELAASLEAALRLLDDDKQDDDAPKYDGFGVPL